MKEEKILNTYIKLIEKNYCADCNELNCIDNFPNDKIAKAIIEMLSQNKKLKYYKNKALRLQQENKKLQGNWNTLKIWLKCNDLDSLQEYYTDGIETILNKIEELEKGEW